MRTDFKKLVVTVASHLFRLVRIPIKWYWKKFNIKTYGVRILIIYQNKFVLVRHWYNSLWVMPGGGIKKYETPEQAAVREIREELGFDVKQLDYELGVYSNTKEGKNDTVYCFVVKLEERPTVSKRFNLEVSDIIWADMDNPPNGTSGATLKRIHEHLTCDTGTQIRPWS